MDKEDLILTDGMPTWMELKGRILSEINKSTVISLLCDTYLTKHKIINFKNTKLIFYTIKLIERKKKGN